MNKTSVQFDSSQFDAMVKGLTGPEVKKAMIGALKSGANILKKETEKQFRSKVAIGDARVSRVNKKGKEIARWKRLATVKVDKKTPSAKVHIMSDFRAKFFEMGTKGRKTKGHKISGYYRLRSGGRQYRARTGKGGYRGRINAGRFFLKAQRLTERKIFSNMDSVMGRLIIKIAKRRK